MVRRYLIIFGVLVYTKLISQQEIWLNEAYPQILQWFYQHSGQTNWGEEVNNNRINLWSHTAWGRFTNIPISLKGVRRGYHYTPDTRGITGPVELTHLEYLCLVVRYPPSGCGERYSGPCHDSGISQSQGWWPTILAYEVPLGMDAFQANRRARDYYWFYRPTEAEVNTITTENTGAGGYNATGCRYNNILLHRFNLPERARLRLQPDRRTLLVLTFTPKNNVFEYSSSDLNASAVRSYRRPYDCVNGNGHVAIDYEYETYHGEEPSRLCEFNYGPGNWFPYRTMSQTRCFCNRLPSYQDYWVFGFKGRRVGGCGSDIDCSGCVDDSDLLTTLFNFGSSGQGDVNNDGVVDDGDLLAVLFDFGSGC